jgi:VIT1/CCC1 family predicted Fe2+/Mn2+ transporter
MQLMARYIKDVVYGANDGLITTFAVIASVIGADLGTRVILIVGTASLLADGVSMAASDYLASQSERSATEAANDTDGVLVEKRPVLASAVTFASFVAAGALPLLPFLFFPGQTRAVWASSLAMAAALFLIGMLRTRVTKRAPLGAGAEMLLIGGSAAAIAFFVARYVSGLTPAV